MNFNAFGKVFLNYNEVNEFNEIIINYETLICFILKALDFLSVSSQVIINSKINIHKCNSKILF